MEEMKTTEGDQWLVTLTSQVKNPQEELEYYQKTAGHYEKSLYQMNYSAPDRCMQMLQSYEESSGKQIPRNGKAIDVGAGTGLSGLALKRYGFLGELDALEPSDNMFELAREKKIYSKRYPELLLPDKETSIPSCYYDLVIAIGVFSDRSLTRECMQEVIRMAKSGGAIVVVQDIRFWETLYKPLITELQQQKIVTLERLEFFDDYLASDTGVGYILRKEPFKN